MLSPLRTRRKFPRHTTHGIRPSVRRHPWRACSPFHGAHGGPRASARTRSLSSRTPRTSMCAASRREPGAGAHAGRRLGPQRPPRHERHHGDPVHHASPSELSTASRRGAGLARRDAALAGLGALATRAPAVRHGDGAGRGGGVLRSPRAGGEARRPLLVRVVVEAASQFSFLGRARRLAMTRCPRPASLGALANRGVLRLDAVVVTNTVDVRRLACERPSGRRGDCWFSESARVRPCRKSLQVRFRFRIFLGAVNLSRVLGFRFHSLTESNSKLASRFLIYKSFGVLFL